MQAFKAILYYYIHKSIIHDRNKKNYETIKEEKIVAINSVCISVLWIGLYFIIFLYNNK